MSRFLLHRLDQQCAGVVSVYNTDILRGECRKPSNPDRDRKPVRKFNCPASLVDRLSDERGFQMPRASD
jgi:hypothetical protein